MEARGPQSAHVEAAPRPAPLAAAWRDLAAVISISFPVIVAMASHTLMGFVDTWLLAEYGRDEVAAVGAAGSVVFIFIAFVFGTSNCTSAFVAQSLGRGSPGDCSRYAWQGVYFGLLAQVALLPVIVLAGHIFAAFGHESQVQAMETIYLRLRLLHAAGTAAYAALTSFFQGIGKPVIPMYAALIANVFNAILDAVLIFGLWGFPEMGITGAALATVVASYFQVALLFAWFFRGTMRRAFATGAHWRPDLARFAQLMRIGAPAGLSFMLHTASWAIFTNILIGRLGSDILAANNITHAIIRLSFMPAIGVSKGVTVLVGQSIGRRNIPTAKRRAYAGMGLAMFYMTLMGLLFVAFRGQIIRLFRDEAQIVEAGTRMLILAAVFQAFDALGIVSYGALRGAGDTRFPAIVDVASGWLLLLPLGYALTFPLGLGYVGAWAAAAFQIAVVGTIFFLRFIGEAWRKIDIFATRKPPRTQ